MEVLPNSLVRILQDLFHGFQLQEKWSVASTWWHVSYLLGCIPAYQLMYLSACAPRDAVVYQPFQRNIYGSWLVWFIFNPSSFTYLSRHLMFHHQHIRMLCICVALVTHNFNMTKKGSRDVFPRSMEGLGGWLCCLLYERTPRIKFLREMVVASIKGAF